MDDRLALCWQNLSVYTTIKSKTLWKPKRVTRVKLLSNVSGILRSGTLSAIMGPSGTGKTTLLAAISQRNTGQMHGDITLNGRPVDKDLMVRMAGFVPQQDLAIQTLTVREHIQFMASLKMDRRVSPVQKSRIISMLIQDLGLSSCSTTQLLAISGGEKKRVCLAVQLLTDPPILLCDEPTTGLDSYTASSVVGLLRGLASKGKAVLCSVHQPASGIFEMFDTVSLLVPGGRLAYFGEVDGAKKHFADMGLLCPPAYNTAEFVVKQLNTMPDRLSEKFTTSKAFVKLHKEIESVRTSSLHNQLIYGMDEKFLKFFSVQEPTKNTQLKWLLWRAWLDFYRNSQKILLQLFMYIMIAFLISSPYSQIRLDQEGIQNLQGLNYSVITETVFTHSYAVMHTFPAEIPVLLREIGNGVYQPAPYYLAKVLFLIPKVMIETILFCAVIYSITGIEGGGFNGYLKFCAPVIVSAVASAAYGCCISAMFENIANASLLSVPVDFISYTFSGLFLQLSTTPVYLYWIRYVSRFYYGLEALSILQWMKIDSIPCSPNPELPCINSGEGVLLKYGYDASNLAIDFLGLTAMFFILHLVGYIFLKRRSQKQAMY